MGLYYLKSMRKTLDFRNTCTCYAAEVRLRWHIIIATFVCMSISACIRVLLIFPYFFPAPTSVKYEAIFKIIDTSVPG